MKLFLPVVLVFIVLAGCRWTPERDSTVDPNSPFYVLPHFNRRPAIDSVKMITDCREDLIGDQCVFEVQCWVSDSDRNIIYDSLIARVDTVVLGRMAFDPDIRGFSIRRGERDMPAGDLDHYVGDSIWVTVVDDSGAQTSRGIEFHQPVRSPWPLKNHPVGETGPDIVTDYHPRLGWFYWGNLDDGHKFSVLVQRDGQNDVWDTTGLAPADTFIVITDSLSDSNLRPVNYSWTLTVTNRRGDKLTCRPGHFQIWTDMFLRGKDRRIESPK
ncbi:MAG TPA: hypothetical protein VGL38_12160 [bacterium]|jgi:hypothetical protein